MSEDRRKNHLVVLIHGLWGSAQNLSRLESVLHHSLDETPNCKLHTYAPDCFSHFKTYDGIESIGGYIIPNLFKHLEKLQAEHGIVIEEISFVGYSLGGLIARYIIGELFEVGFFEKIKPGFFTTFATPHLGVTFYNSRILNVCGSHFLGQTGRDLFLVENVKGIVYKLCDPDRRYYRGLNLFKTKICVANAKFDRTVGFYSAFITKYDVFNDWNSVNPKYIKDLPTATLIENGKQIQCMVIDFNESERIDPAEKRQDPSQSSPSQSKFAMTVLLTVGFMLFPVIFSVSLFATIKSYLRRRILPKPDFAKLWKATSAYFELVGDEGDEEQSSLLSTSESQNFLKDSDKKQDDDDGYNEADNLQQRPIGVSHITRAVVENGLNMIDEDVDADVEQTISKKSPTDTSKLYSIDVDFELDYKSRSGSVKELVNNLINNDLSDVALTKNLDPLPFNDVRQRILDNLNSLSWTKIAVLLHNLNAHQSVVGRRGFERTPESIPFLFLYSFLIDTSMKQSSE
ncbi:hypothetical protein PMKS-003888 [Pichia membranifaciens]|uniref:DUF676 domain-containing protein n=1 Tax=Pichia membranifaciens TaxID=4926 RepID=A0A1Q2YLE5_9ASCO|nr:hypothetical protein PMKS-003888 [Pichia membranifaciens]